MYTDCIQTPSHIEKNPNIYICRGLQASHKKKGNQKTDTYGSNVPHYWRGRSERFLDLTNYSVIYRRPSNADYKNCYI